MQYLQTSLEDFNPFRFLPIPGYANHEISLRGTVRNRRTGRILRTFIKQSSTRHYVHCILGRIHRLLMSAIMGRPLAADELVCHRNGDTYDNVPRNLRVGSARQNALDRISTNTNGRTLRNQDVRDIRHLASKFSRADLARRYRVTAGAIGLILTGKRWRNLP